MRKLLTLITLLMMASLSNAQEVLAPSIDYSFDSYHKNVYAEFLGSTLIIGGHFDMRLNKGRMDGIGFAIGAGGFSFSNNSRSATYKLGVLTLPLELNHITGKGRAYFVTGVGILPAYVSFTGSGPITGNEFVDEEGFGLIGGFLNLGFRLQPKVTGFMMQLNWNPLIVRKTGFQPAWFGLSLGVGFK